MDLYARDANGATDISLLAIIVVTISAHLVNLNEGRKPKILEKKNCIIWGFLLCFLTASRAKIDPAEAVESVIASN